MPSSIHGWYKYPAVTQVTCPIGVSVPVMCSPSSVCVYRCPFSLRCVLAVGLSSECPCSDTIRCHHVASAAILLRHPDEWRCVLSAFDRWRIVVAPPGGVSRQVWKFGGRALMARVGCRGTEDMSAGGFSTSGNGFWRNGLRSCPRPG